MEFLIILQLLIQFLPLLFVVMYLWTFYYLCMPIDLLLQFEEGDLHPPAFSRITLATNGIIDKGGQQPSKTNVNITQDTVPSDGVDELKCPIQCSNDNEDGIGTASVVECGSEEDETQQLVVTASRVFQLFNTQMIPSVNVPEQFNVQVMPPVAIPQQSGSQVAPLNEREFPPPAAKEINQPALQQIQDTCNTSYQDSCDDSEPEEDGNERESSVPCGCDSDLEEMMILQGALLCSSDDKLDQAGKSEETVEEFDRR